MVMTAPPWLAAVRELAARATAPPRRILLSPQGTRLNEEVVRRLAAEPELILLCARYEGIDDRVRQLVVDEEISIGDYVLSGGEIPAMVLVEALARQIPGVVGLADSVEHDSFRDGLLDFPSFTRPREVEGIEAPEILLSGHHARIESWRRREALRATLLKRPDLFHEAELDRGDRRTLAELAEENEIDLPEAT